MTTNYKMASTLMVYYSCCRPAETYDLYVDLELAPDLTNKPGCTDIMSGCAAPIDWASLLGHADSPPDHSLLMVEDSLDNGQELEESDRNACSSNPPPIHTYCFA